jgi:hypothetical protein
MYVLIDTERMLASTRSGRPFNREPFQIQNVTWPMLIFDVGPERFVAVVENQTMRLTKVRFPGQFTLRLEPPRPGL